MGKLVIYYEDDLETLKKEKDEKSIELEKTINRKLNKKKITKKDVYDILNIYHELVMIETKLEKRINEILS